MAPQENTAAAKPDDLGSVPQPYTVEGKLSLALLEHLYTLTKNN